MSIINGHGWQNVAANQHRNVAAVTGIDAQAYQSETALASTVSTVSRPSAASSASDSSYQDTKDAQDEAFAKLKVALQNIDTGSSDDDETTGVSASAKGTTGTSAAEQFRDYMALSPAEKIRLRMLSELGLTEDDYEALPPEKKEKIDLAIAQRIKDESELKSMGKAEPQMQAAMAAQNLSASLSQQQREAADPAQARKEREEREDPLKV